MSLKDIQNLVLEALNQSKINQEKSLEFYFHLKTSNSQTKLFNIPEAAIKTIKASSLSSLSCVGKNHPQENDSISSALKIFISENEKSIVHIVLNLDEASVFLYQNLKYFFLLSESIVIYFDSEIEKFETLKFFFISAIENYFRGSNKNSYLKLIQIGESSLYNTGPLNENIGEIWEEALKYSGLTTPLEILKIEDMFSIENVEDINSQKIEKVIEKNFASTQQSSNTNIVSVKNFSEISSSILEASEAVPYLPENLVLDEKYKEIHDSYIIGKIFNDLWLTANNVINHWSSYVSKGKAIENFGENVSNFLTGMLEEFEKTLPADLRSEKKAFEKIKDLSDMVKGRIVSLFTSQLLILQTQALDKFKDLLVWQAKHSSNEFEFEKGVSILQVNEWFETRAKKISVPEMRLEYSGAQKELQQVLGDVAEKFKDSAVSKLISIQKTTKKTSKGKFKQSGIVVGFGMTAAVRPRGFGNLQLVTSYTQGPHVFNFSLINDLDVAEQEGQTRIKPIRIQPSLNFDVDV